MREGTSVPSDMSNTSSLFKYQGHDRVKTENYVVTLMRHENADIWTYCFNTPC